MARYYDDDGNLVDDQDQPPYNPYLDEANYASAGQPTPNELGGYETAPPISNGTGAPQPGWEQGANGLYNFAAPGTSSVGAALTGNSGGGQPFGKQPPSWLSMPGQPSIGEAPRPDLPTFERGPKFDFHAPTPESMLGDPSYKFRVGQGFDALQRWAAAKGTLNDSGTAKALQDYGQNAASQEYNNIFNREWSTQTGAYDKNYQTQTIDPYKFNYQRGLDLWSPAMETWRQNAGLTAMGYQGSLNDTAAHNRAMQDEYLNEFNTFLG